MIKILQRVARQVAGEFRDIIHGNKNLGQMMEAKYSGSSVNQEVTVEEAMQIPAVEAAVELITSSIASLPIRLQREDRAEEIIEVKNDRRTFLLNREPNRIMNAHNFKKQLVQDYLFYGEAYIKIDMRPVGNQYQSLHLLDPRYITKKKRIRSGYLIDVEYIYDNPEIENVAYIPGHEMIAVLKNSKDGVSGTGILEQGNKILRLALNEMDYSASILENGAVPLGMLKTDGIVSEKAMERLRASFDSAYQGAKNTGKTIILENGLTYQPISLKPNDLDLGNSKKSTLSNISRLFGVPESMINSEANKYSSNEQNNIHFLQYCIAPILSSVTSAFNKSLLLESEKDRRYEFVFDTSTILQTTEKEKIDAVGKGLEHGLFTINEARRRLDLPDISSTDFYKAKLGEVFISAETGMMAIPNIGRVIDPVEMDKAQLVKSDIAKLEQLLNDINDPVVDIDEALEGQNKTKMADIDDDINDTMDDV